jgi:hypothetical protein
MGLLRESAGGQNPKRPLMQRCRSVTSWSSGEVTLTIVVVLDVQRERAADAAVRADRVGHWSARLVPRAGGAHVVLALEHQRAGRADADAVAAVDARRVGQRDVELGRDAGVEAAAGDRDRERVLGVLAARLDALVAEDALRVVADVEVVVDLDRLGDGGGRRRRLGRVVVARARARRARPAGGGRGRRAVALGIGVVALDVAPVGTAGAVERSTDEPRNSSTILRLRRTRSESVWTSIPGSTLREHAGTRTREPSTSTTQTRQTLTGVRFSR